MVNNRKILLLVSAFAVMVSSTGCAKLFHTHTFADATCTAPKTCTECGETEGEPLNHNFKMATCMAPQTCTMCGHTEGATAAHNYKDATCTSGAKCSVCGKTDGSALGHSTSVGKCSRCNSLQGSSTIKKVEDYILSGSNYILDGSDEFLIYYSYNVNTAITMAKAYYDLAVIDLESAYNVCGNYPSLYGLKSQIKSVLDNIPTTTRVSTNSELTAYLEQVKAMSAEVMELNEYIIDLFEDMGYY